jgi:hypothetical protein
MKKVRFSELSKQVQQFLEAVKSCGSIAVVDDDDQLQCGVTPYYRANDQERAAAWQRLELLQQEVGRRMAEKGITEDDIDRVLQEDD